MLGEILFFKIQNIHIEIRMNSDIKIMMIIITTQSVVLWYRNLREEK